MKKGVTIPAFAEFTIQWTSGVSPTITQWWRKLWGESWLGAVTTVTGVQCPAPWYST